MARSTLSSPAAAPGTPAAGLDVQPVPGRPIALNLLLSLRPGQWTKNLLVFAGLLFGNASVHRGLFDPPTLIRSTAAFVIFCALSGVIYIINDVMDREADRRHPLKARRPIASGALSVPAALTAAVVLAGGGLAGAFAIGWKFAIAAVAYLALLALYSGPLKQIVIIDV